MLLRTCDTKHIATFLPQAVTDDRETSLGLIIKQRQLLGFWEHRVQVGSSEGAVGQARFPQEEQDGEERYIKAKRKGLVKLMEERVRY